MFDHSVYDQRTDRPETSLQVTDRPPAVQFGRLCRNAFSLLREHTFVFIQSKHNVDSHCYNNNDVNFFSLKRPLVLKNKKLHLSQDRDSFLFLFFSEYFFFPSNFLISFGWLPHYERRGRRWEKWEV